MTFWTALRWAGTLVFVLVVFISWLGAGHNSVDNGDSAQQARPAPLFIR